MNKKNVSRNFEITLEYEEVPRKRPMRAEYEAKLGSNISSKDTWPSLFQSVTARERSIRISILLPQIENELPQSQIPHGVISGSSAIPLRSLGQARGV